MDKVKWLKGWEGLERVLLCLPDGGVVRFEGEAFRDWEAKDEKGVLEGAREKVRTQLEGMVGEMGWKGVKKALLAKEIA